MKTLSKTCGVIFLIFFTMTCHGNNLFNGDFRFRYQREDVTGGGTRDRLRIRFRIGKSINIGDVWLIGFGLATGGNDPRSTNETLDNSFETPDIRLDYAYAEYTKINNTRIYLGKYKGIKKSLMIFSDLLWDSDIRPEGIGMKYNMKSIGINTGMFIIDENKQDKDPVLLYIQPTIKVNITNNSKIETFITYYNFMNIVGQTLDYSSGTNTTDSLGNLLYKYNVVHGGFRITLKNTLIPFFSLFGEIAYNTAITTNNIAYLGGIKIGQTKMEKIGDWQIKYMYRYLESDSWLDIFPDSDAFGGSTNITSHEAEIKIGLSKHVYGSLDVYHSQTISANNTQNLAQLDLVWKF